MALATATISYDLADLTGVDFDYRRTKVWTTTNIDDQTVIDTEGNAIRLGSGNGSVASDGTGSVEVWIPGTGSNPASWQTYIHVDYPDRNANKGRGRRTFGPFTITVSANLADLVDEQEVPPDFSGSGFIAEAQAILDAQEAVAGLTGEDAAVALLVETPSSDTATALSATIAGAAPPKEVGPRSLPRVKHGLAPALHIDAIYPRTGLGEWAHRLLSTEGATWWAFGRDGSLRQSATEGRTWVRRYKSDGTGVMGKDGLWIKTTAGSLLTTWHPFSGAEPSIKRSTDDGVTWSTVVAATTNVKFLGVTSLCQSPTTGYLYLAEYVTTDAVATINIKRSTDDGVTWTAWKALTRNASAESSNVSGITHVHGIQVDPIDSRVWVCVGDAPPSAGLYRLTTDETDWEAVATNRQLDTASGIWGGAVGLMFFPDYIAWGVDQSYTSGLVRMARTEIGQAAPVVEKVMDLNSTGFYTCRTSTANTEWVLSASQEGGSSAIDNAVHLYRVADNGETVDEIGSIPSNSASSFSWAYPLGTPLQTRSDGLMWWGTNIFDGQGNAADTEMTGVQFSARVGWSHSATIRPAPSRPFEQPVSVSSGVVAGMAAGSTKNFAATVVPVRARRLYVLNLGAKSWTVGPVASIEITDSAGTVINNDVGTPLAVAAVDWRVAGQDDSVPYMGRTAALTAGSEVRFRIKNTSGSLSIDASGFVTYAWGY